MFDVVTIGSALVDIFVHSDQFQLHQEAQKVLLCQDFGEKIEVESLTVHTGGGASNTAVGFQRLGFSTAVIAETGRDAFSQLVDNEFSVEKVDKSLLIREHKEQTGGSVILVSQDGGRTVLVHRGAASQLDTSDIPQAKLLETSWIHLSSISGRLDVLKLLFELAQTNHIPISWNPGKGELELLTTGKLDVKDLSVQIMLLNASEWASVKDYQSALLTHIPEVVVTDGKQGGQVFKAGVSPITYQADDAQAVDDTGAGDAFAVGYVSARLLEYPLDKAMTWGVRNSASVVEYFGAKPGLLRRSELDYSES